MSTPTGDFSPVVQSYFNPDTLTNSFVVHGLSGTAALIVDPCGFDLPLFKLLEAGGLTVGAVLLTHATDKAAHAIRTMLSVYDFTVFGGEDAIGNLPMRNIKHLAEFEAASLPVKPLFIPGLYMDSLAYRIGDCLFPGEMMSAGAFISAGSAHGQVLLVQSFRELIAPLPGHTLILPSYGPPSTVAVELASNLPLAQPSTLS